MEGRLLIPNVLRAMAENVEERAAATTCDTHFQPTAAQQAARADRVRTVARDIRSLADAAETRSVNYAEFSVLKDRLYAFGFPLTPKLEQDIAAAFHDARGPVKAREKGWLNRP